MVFEERKISILATQMLLIRVMIGKIEKTDRLEEILRQVPIKQGEPGWNCVFWVKEALEALVDGKVMGTSVLDWNKVRHTAMSYCQEKKDLHRFDGKGDFDMSKAATYDLIQSKETIR